MKIAIMESIMTPGGHEVDFDRLLVEELRALGHDVFFYVPEQFSFSFDYGAPVKTLPGQVVSYTGLKGWRKLMSSAKKEVNRQRWYKALYEKAKHREFDACIIPTSTYRYLRALNLNELKKSPVPIIFILHGINPQEAPKFFHETEKLESYQNIKMAVITLWDQLYGKNPPKVSCLYPPTYTPRDIVYKPVSLRKDVLTLGFFGQYRREKKLDDFLDVFIKNEYKRPVELLVQGATIKPEDSADFERIQEKYKSYQQIRFLHKGLIGKEWQEAISKIDVLLMPYSASRYRYHWAGMLFTAIGYQKPVIASDDINPEVFDQYDIGLKFTSGNLTSLEDALKTFINTFDEKREVYQEELERASQDFSPESFVRKLVKLAEEKG